MSKFNNSKVMPRYFFIAVVLTLIGFAIIGKALYIMTAKKDYWTEVQKLQKRDSIPVKPNRGNILSCDGQLMASSIPEYRIYMDFVAGGEEKDQLLTEQMDSICTGLHEIFPEQSAEEFRRSLEEGRAKKSQHWPIVRHRIDYDTYTQVKKLPVFRLSRYKGGFMGEASDARRRPFGSLAQRTIGDMYHAKDSARLGLELSYDSLLRGQTGLMRKQKVLNKMLQVTVEEPVDGYDIVTTIDVGMQDLAERAVIDELKEINGDLGVAILMEVKTGDVKAIVNMTKCYNDRGEVVYREVKNNAVADLREPGSVFKTASLLVALDDGVCDTTRKVDTGSGVYKMYGRDMKDHNWRRGGYQVISLPRSLEVSSNIGVSRIIDDYYHKNPEKFVQGIYRVGLAEDLHLPFQGAATPKIRMPKKDKTGRHWQNWSKTALPWMSIGYETQIPPISTVTFYNAIANNGKMMRPRFVKKLMKNGEPVREFPPEVIKEQIAKPKSIATMQTILEHVVSQGLGKRAGSNLFKVAGKTGTAQIAEGGGGYHSGTMQYWLSFAGYFPADNPRYTCIVCLKKSGLPASGGGMSGLVFHNIAEGVMAQNVKFRVDDAKEEYSVFTPDVKAGNESAANYVMANLGVSAPTPKTAKTPANVVPDVKGMGARDAIFLMESRGIKVKVQGCGSVCEQSLMAGKVIKPGMICELKLRRKNA